MRVFQLQREPGTRHYLIYVPGLNARKNVVAGVQKKRKHQLVIGCGSTENFSVTYAGALISKKARASFRGCLASIQAPRRK